MKIHVKVHIILTRLFLLFLIFAVLVWVFLEKYVNQADTSIIVARIALDIIVLLVFLFTWLNYFKLHYRNFLIILLGIGFFTKIISEIITLTDGSMSTALVSVVTFVIVNPSTYYVFIENLIHLIVFLARWYYFIWD